VVASATESRPTPLGHQRSDNARTHACVRPTPPLPHAPPSRGLLRSASRHLALLDRRKRQVGQLCVSFTLVPPAASLAHPCSTAARAPGAEHAARSRASTRHHPFCPRVSGYKNPLVTYCLCPTNVYLLDARNPRCQDPLFSPFLPLLVTARPVSLPSLRVGPETPLELNAACRAVGATPRRRELARAVLMPPLSPLSW
jgi:hypothetical protein